MCSIYNMHQCAYVFWIPLLLCTYVKHIANDCTCRMFYVCVLVFQFLVCFDFAIAAKENAWGTRCINIMYHSPHQRSCCVGPRLMWARLPRWASRSLPLRPSEFWVCYHFPALPHAGVIHKRKIDKNGTFTRPVTHSHLPCPRLRLFSIRLKNESHASPFPGWRDEVASIETHCLTYIKR